MTALPMGPRGRLLAIGLTAVALAALWLAAVAPLLEWHAARAETVARRTALAVRMAAVAETLPRLRREAGAGGEPAPTLLEGASDSVAGAALQGRVGEMASRAGVTLGSAELLAAETAGGYRRIGLRIAVNGPWPALVALLRALEEGTPRTLVDDLQVSNAPSIAPGAGRPVSAGLTVIAFRAGDGGAR